MLLKKTVGVYNKKFTISLLRLNNESKLTWSDNLISGDSCCYFSRIWQQLVVHFDRWVRLLFLFGETKTQTWAHHCFTNGLHTAEVDERFENYKQIQRALRHPYESRIANVVRHADGQVNRVRQVAHNVQERDEDEHERDV